MNFGDAPRLHEFVLRLKVKLVGRGFRERRRADPQPAHQ
jgi:hypothetical protein